jgi:hypothetical protein
MGAVYRAVRTMYATNFQLAAALDAQRTRH